MSDAPSTESIASLAEDIRQQSPAFVASATTQFEALIRGEMHRLRGYAFENGVHEMRLNVGITFDFTPGRLGVVMQTVPQFVPVPRYSHQAVVVPTAKGS